MRNVETGERTRVDEPAAGRKAAGGRRPISFLLGKVRDELLLLLRQEIALARAETAEKAKLYSRNVMYAAAGAAIAFTGVIFLLLAATYGLAFALREGGVAAEHALWIAPLIVGTVVAIVGYIFIQKAINTFRRESPMPRKTVRSLQEDARWLRDKVTP